MFERQTPVLGPGSLHNTGDLKEERCPWLKMLGIPVKSSLSMAPWKWHQALIWFSGNPLWVLLLCVCAKPALALGPQRAVQDLKQECSTWARWASHQNQRALLRHRAGLGKKYKVLGSSRVAAAVLQLLTKSYVWFRSKSVATLPLETTRYWNVMLSKSSDCCNSC